MHIGVYRKREEKEHDAPSGLSRKMEAWSYS